VAGVTVVSWILVLVSLPDFERYKPVPKLAAVVEAQPVRADRVGTFKVAAPSLVFYLRRHVDQMVDDRQSGLCRSDQGLDFKGGQAGVDRYGAGAEFPDGQKFGKEFQAVAEGQEDAVSPQQPMALEAGDPPCDLARYLLARP
jgi:hypothetical protein